jgi:hypothetical protein
MLRSMSRSIALAAVLAVLPATALAQRQTITLASNDPANVYTDASGLLRDATVRCTHYAPYPVVDGNQWTATLAPGFTGGTVAEDAYAIEPFPGAWAVIPGAGWVNYLPTPYSTGMSYYFGPDLSGPYHALYEVDFEMPAVFSNATVEIQYSGDDWMNASMNGQVFVDQHSPVIGLYFFGVQPPPEFCTFSCISTTTVADAAQFLVPGHNSFSVKQWDPDGAGGASFLVTISYDPIDPLQALLGTLEELRAAVAALPPSDFNNANQQLALLNQLAAEVKQVQGGLYLEARAKMAGDILAKMDGFAKAGAADANDWIRTADAQAQVYPLGARALELLNSLL